MRYMNVYGPRMDYKGTYVSVIMKVLDKIEAGERPTIFGDGSRHTTSSTSATSRGPTSWR
jgi:UDP-glucose 4-epimerase